MRSKITVIGAGFVGSTLIQRLVERDYADVVTFDIIPNMPQGKALDMLQAGPVLGYDSLVVDTNDYADTAKSDIVVPAICSIQWEPSLTDGIFHYHDALKQIALET